MLAPQRLDSKFEANRSLHGIAKRATVVIQGALKHGKQVTRPAPGINGRAAAYRAMLAGLFDIAILDTMTFERRHKVGCSRSLNAGGERLGTVLVQQWRLLNCPISRLCEIKTNLETVSPNMSNIAVLQYPYKFRVIVWDPPDL